MKKSTILMLAVALMMILSGCKEKEPLVQEGQQDLVTAGSFDENMVWTIDDERYQDLFTGGSFDDNMVWTTDDENYSDLISRLSEKCESTLEGSMIVATDDKVILAGGWNSIETDGETRVNPFTTYEIGSTTKQLVAACILQQVQEGNIKTDETIDKYFPDFPHGSRITVDHLLHMDSGIVDYVNEANLFFEDNSQFEAYNRGEMTDETLMSLINKSNLKFEPGKQFSYSNTNYYLLALILEQVTGKTYEEYMKENIFDVCGMPSSTNTEVGNITSVPANGGKYMAAARCARGAGDVHSNVCDMLRWDRALMSHQILNPEQVQYMTEMRNGYSCGWMSRMSGNIEHSGSTPSYVSLNTIIQTKDMGNVYVITMTSNPGKAYVLQHIATMVEETVLANQDQNQSVQLPFRFADAKEGADFLTGNTAYLNKLNQNDLDYRMQKKGATQEEYIAFAAEQTLDFKEEEKVAVSATMQRIMDICTENQYHLPDIGEITFVKTTMKEESGATAYTHGNQIYLGKELLLVMQGENQRSQNMGTVILAHELFHCFTRNDPQFRKDIYEIIGFHIQEEEFEFSPAIQEQMIHNPDVGKNDSYATFRIEGKDRECVLVFTTIRPFNKAGDNMLELHKVGLVPIDDLSVMYSKNDAENFWDVFGKNTEYVLDPEEALADNFSYAILYGVDGAKHNSPEIIQAICDYLKMKEL